MFYLKLFGGASIEADGVPLAGTVAQRRRLALLALLAASAPRGISRERLAAYLFPEANAARARGALSDALHGVRKALGRDAVITVGDELRLDPTVVGSDVAEFEAALAAGDLPRAVSLYQGPFLDGFFVSDAPEFERWVAAKRESFGRKYAEVLEALARQREAAGDPAAQVQWLRKLAAHAPFDSRVAARLMQALGAAGDPGGALQQARTHQILLREELGIEPSAEIEAIAARLKVGAHDRSRESAPVALETEPATPVGTGTAQANGILASKSMPATASHRQTRARRRGLTIAAATSLVVVIAIALVALTRRTPERMAIAVLPFQNLSAEGPHAYFAGGLHSEIQTQLTKVAALRVISQTSTMDYARGNAPLRRIARELGVGSVVEGSVQVVGDRLRVNVRLIDAATGGQLWAERYDRALEDAFAVQSDVAQQIVTAVGAALSSDERRGMAEAPTVNTQAYQFYLQGRDYLARTGGLRQNYESAQQLFERAVAIDPSFALARAALSEVHGWMYWVGHDRSPLRLTRQREEAEAALRLAPDLPQAHLAMGLAHYHGRRDHRRALDELQIALRGLPNDAALVTSLGAVHRRLGNWDEVVATYHTAIQLDPRSARALYALGQTYGVTRRYAEAVRTFDRAMSLAPDHHAAAVTKGWIYVRWQGTLDTLRAALARLPSDAHMAEFGTRAAIHVGLLHLERRPDSLLAVLAASPPGVFQGQGSFHPTSLYAAWAHQLRGDRPAARAAFDTARALLDSVTREDPNDRRVRAALGLVLAGLGRGDDALREARWLRHSVVYREDAYEGPYVALDRAQILAQAGEADAALDEINRLLTKPSVFSVHLLRLDPLWDPIREHPRFKALLAKYGAR